MLTQRSFWGIHLSAVMTLTCGVTMLQPPTFAQGQTTGDTEATSLRYFIGPGDQILVTVFGYEEYTGQHLVLADGTITLPIIGTVRAGNLTLGQLTQDLTARLRPYLVDPVVTVSLTNLRPVSVNVAGEVQRPGPTQLRSITNTSENVTFTVAGINSLQAPTVSAAILEAGGVTRQADIRRVVLKRFNPNGDSPTVTINLWDTLFSEDAPRDLTLRDGDSIFVPKLNPGDSIDRKLIARSSFAPKTVRVRVVGEVKRPGEIEVSPNSSISSAIAVAGGPTDKAKLSKVSFVRLREDGTVEEQIINIDNLTDTYQIQEGDVVYVPKSNTSSALDFARDLVNPLNLLLDILGL